MKKPVEIVIHSTKSGREFGTETKLRDISRLIVVGSGEGVLSNLKQLTKELLTEEDLDGLPIVAFEVPITYSHTTGKVKIGEPWRSNLIAWMPKLKVNIVSKIERYRFKLDEKLQKEHLENTVPEADKKSKDEQRL